MGADERRELNHRREAGLDVTMWYHGKDADPKITVEVLDFETGMVTVVEPPLDEVMDAFLHPFSYPGYTAVVSVATAIP